MKDIYERILESVNAWSQQTAPAAPPSFVAAVTSSQQPAAVPLTDERFHVSHQTGQRRLQLEGRTWPGIRLAFLEI